MGEINTVEDKVIWLQEKIGFVPADVDDYKAIDFYYRAMHDHDFGLCDVDDYAYLNTLFGYDIEIENARKLIVWFYEENDSTVQDAITVEDKDTLRNICESELDLNLDFSKFTTEEPEYYQIY